MPSWSAGPVTLRAGRLGCGVPVPAWGAREDLALQRYLEGSPTLWRVIERLASLRLPDAYVAAGAVAQTVWNGVVGNEPSHGVKDVDIVYFDTDLDEAVEGRRAAVVREALSDVPLRLDVANEARVHLWYGRSFGYEIEPYASVEGAIDTFPTTATAVGVRLSGSRLQVYAPFGLEDLLGLVVRPNKRQVTQAIYRAKVSRWQQLWPDLRVVDW